ncbi:type I-E CRISPR-associated protein Cas5/CasD [Jeongeupia sp. HS-3]|uniref:type I-E CRISPR-associated protein Cas5/CasD n=1 Tax=Jeongeupia sp. HS-3 TaxID=1009682 RepID=UPI0018A68B67|nr:type I-E CRISPR-associated protein Cas5/CasD [Jeongeupia sp. HS-3]BCL75808.1 type I-E CRISPR-associated protein Cas5/CasD [Jeongeupia sp. HS-3]
MSDYLVFRLYGPMASWGEIAVGESRHSAAQPSRSALIGLLAAALGIRRDDDAAQAALATAYRFGVKLAATGMPLRDYHTVQAPGRQKKVTYRTRRQELADPAKLRAPLLSAREYRVDSLAIIAVEALPDAPHGLAELAGALDRPHFPLYLGRKSCPLAAPLAATVVASPDLKAALDGVDAALLLPGIEGARASRRLKIDRAARYFWDQGMEAGMPVTMTQVRHDQPISRRRWQFAPRNELVHLAEEGL